MKTDPKLDGWDVVIAGETVIMIYDPWKHELQELARWVDTETYANQAALLKGVIGRMYGPTFISTI